MLGQFLSMYLTEQNLFVGDEDLGVFNLLRLHKPCSGICWVEDVILLNDSIWVRVAGCSLTHL